MELDAALANDLFEEGAVLVIAGVPVGTEFGIDLWSNTVGKNFRGVKMIPPGPHFVWCASQGLYGDVAPRVGFIHYFHQKEILVREWDHDNEELRQRKIADPALEIQRLRENLRTLDRYLAPYDYQAIGEWKHLTDAISEGTVERCRPALGTIRTQVEFQSCPDAERPRGTQNSGDKALRHLSSYKLTMDENDLLPDLKPVEGTAPRFTVLPERVPKNASPAEISQHCMDCAVAVDKLLNVFPNTNALIEEIELAFIFFLVGYSVESLEHWRKLLNLLSNSETAISKYKLVYMKYSELLAYQLPRLPEELMAPTKHNTVYKDVRSLLVHLSVGGLCVSAERLSRNLANSMGWEFPGLLDDDPDDLPVVVEPAESYL